MNAILLIVPLGFSTALVLWLRTRGSGWHAAIAQGVALGFTLPVAIAWCLYLPWPEASGGFFQEALTRFSIALVVIPQVYVLFPAGFVLWRRFLKSGGMDAGIGLALALLLAATALLGHLWTWAILSAGPVAA